MKKQIISLGLLLSGLTGFTQTDSIQAPYKRFPGFPPVQLLLADSNSLFTKNDLAKKKAVMLMIFNPACEHCQHETEEIIKNIDQFKNIQIIMATMMPLGNMKAFIETYKLAQYKNIVVSQDIHFFLPAYFMINTLPFLAFYNKKKELISVFEGSMSIENALKELNK